MKWNHTILEEPSFLCEWQARSDALLLSFQCGTILGNTQTSGHRRLQSLRKLNRHVSFSDDVTVMCVSPSAFACGILHCTHGHVQSSIDHLTKRIATESAPLSFLSKKTAVLSSCSDETSLMQNQIMYQPQSHNAFEGPAWYPFHADPANQEEPSGDEHEDSSDEESSRGSGHDDDDPDSDRAPHPPDENSDRQSAVMFHMGDDPIHAMLYWVDFGTMMTEIAYHYGVGREEVLACHEVVVHPLDIPTGCSPLIVQMVYDIPVGDTSALILLDIETHGQHMENHYQTGPRAVRQVIAVPARLTRHALLMRARVFEYCRLEHYRCLVEHNHLPWHMQSTLPREVKHGDYLKIRIPPPRLNSACTDDALEDSRRLDVADFWSQYYVPSSSSSESVGYASNVSPSLIDSDDIRAEFGLPDDAEESVSLMQRSASAAASSSQAPTPSAYQQSLAANNTCVLEFDPFNTLVRPLWYHALVTTMFDFGAIEDANEGPVVYISTWFVKCDEESTNEDTRIARLDTMANLWVNDIQQLWQDKIIAGLPFYFTWVRPTPVTSPLLRTSGHLIVYQFPRPEIVPALISIHFQALHHDGASLAVIAIRTDATPEHVVGLVNLERVCRGRKCTFHRGAIGFTLNDPIQIGEGLKLGIPPPGGRADVDIVLRSAAVALLNTGEPLIVDPGISFLIEDQIPFVQELHARWLQEARRAPDSHERSLVVHTWYVDGEFVPLNDQCRPVLLDDDFFNWPDELRRVWHDLEDASNPVDFAIVTPTPACRPLEQLHVLLYQQVPSDKAAFLVTIFDNALTHGTPYTTATVASRQASQPEIIDAVGRRQSVALPGVHCGVWYNSLEIIGDRVLDILPGFNVNLIIHRTTLHSWEEADQADDEQQLLQMSMHSNRGNSPNAKHAPPLAQHLKLDLQPTIAALDWYDSFFNLPTFDVEARLEGIAHWHPETLDWIRSPWFAFESSVAKVRIYYDGSFLPTSQTIGFAAAAFVLRDHQWSFAGIISGSDTHAEGHGSYQAEVFAANLATKMLFDICKILREVHDCIPLCEMIFDSLTVGRQSEGLWQACRAVHACHQIRSILRLCEERFAVVVEHCFTPSHVGEAGNEFVDIVAKCAAQGHPLQDWSHFLETTLTPSFVQAVEWAWIVFADLPDVQQDGCKLVFPAKPCTRPASSVIPMHDVVPAGDSLSQVEVKIATCNVLTLRARKASSDFEDCGLVGPARQDWILETFHLHGIHVFGLQETRLRKIVRYRDSRYILIKSAATQQGHFGMMIGLSTTHPHGHVEGKDVYFTDDAYKILIALPRLLIVRLRTDAMKCLVIAAHAPHSGAPLHEAERFWREATSYISEAYRTWPILLLADANCRIGGQPDSRIGSWQSEGMHDKSQPFVDFVAIHDLYLPSTFEHCHHGPGGTWRHANGAWKRSDFIGISTMLGLSKCSTWIPEEIDFALNKEDHRPLFAHLAWNQALPPQTNLRQKVVKPAADDFDATAVSALATQTPQSFHLDVHTHAFEIQQSLLGCCAKRPLRKQAPQKKTISDSTWEVIVKKRKWRNILAQHQTLQTKTLLACVFTAWRQVPFVEMRQEHCQEFDRMLSHLDRSIAFALHQFRTLGRKVTYALRIDDSNFFAALARSASEVLAPQQIREFWKVIRRSLPKFRQRRIGQDPNRLEILQPQWGPYFQELECGRECAPAELVSQCHLRQMAMPVLQQEFQCTELPSLIELEDTLRGTQADRATGLDPLPSRIFSQQVVSLAKLYFPLLLKVYLWQQEPISAKGGVMAVLHKRGPGLLASEYRGIMLLPTISKRIHALLRKRLMFLLSRQKPQGQLGGFAHMEVPYGSQLLRTFGRIMDSLGISSAIIFVDLSNAFHKLVRELVSGVHVPQDVEAVLEQLLHEGIPIDDLIDLLQLPSLMQKLGAPPFLIQLLQDVHTHTWMQVPGRAIYRSSRGKGRDLDPP